MDPIMLQLGPLAIRWYGFLIALGVLFGAMWATRAAEARGLDVDKLLDMVFYLVIAGLIGARLIYVLTSPSRFFGENGNPVEALYVWQGGLSIHGGLLGVILATWIYARIYDLNMWAYLDVMTPAGAFGIIGGRLGNFMNGSDTTGRLTSWPIGFTWPEPGTDTFGAVGRFVFGDNLWAGYPGVCSLGSEVSLFRCTAQGGEIIRGPVHLTQFYGAIVGVILVFILIWAFRRSKVPGFVFWQFILWYSLLRSVLEEPFRDNPIFWNVYLADGLNQPGIGVFTLTQLASIPIILIALYILLVMNPDQGERRDKINKRARGR
ncbi:MAG: prolipoprotein diacylglyceryl transferase [Trueperaceae bacterium]|nr:prolipoprotein diacylglyceryl transferase [Trueperaceae bacterium]